MHARSIAIAGMLVVFTQGSPAQEKGTISGYLSDMQSLYYIPDIQWLWENNLHNRLNFELYPDEWLTMAVQVRTRLITGSTIGKIPGYTDAVGGDQGWIDLTWAGNRELGDSAGVVLTSAVDRLWLQFTFGNLEIKAGRQRINWGQTFAWNPNDIFNTYSYFEVDYPERPGSDAIRIQYYTGSASTVELAAKLDSASKVTAAGYFRINALGYDIQMLGGVYQGEDLFLGTGWSGTIGPASFRGELSWFRDLQQFSDTSGYFMVSGGIDHTFSNSLWIQAEVLYSAFARELNLYNFLQFYAGALDVKKLAFTEWSAFTSLSFPFTPLLSTGFAAIWFPEWKGYYLGPSVDVSLNNDLDLSLIVQHFSAKLENQLGETARQNNTFGFLRIKWNF